MANRTEWAEASYVAENFDVLGPGEEIDGFDGEDDVLPDGQYLLVLDNGSGFIAIRGTSEEIRAALYKWLLAIPFSGVTKVHN